MLLVFLGTTLSTSLLGLAAVVMFSMAAAGVWMTREHVSVIESTLLVIVIVYIARRI
jgi:hypothetical protein